jgi:hypothetical protein
MDTQFTEIVSKSGTNQFHGSAFEFIRNNAFDARNYFATSVPPFQRNEFGATIGGPIFRNKTFFFGEYAGFRQRLGEPTIISVPTSAQRTGVATINDSNGTPYQYQVALNSVASGLLAKYPQPNQPNGIYGPNTYNFLFKQPLDVNQFSVRIDHHFSNKDSFFGRASYINNTSQETDLRVGQKAGAESGGNGGSWKRLRGKSPLRLSQEPWKSKQPITTFPPPRRRLLI